LERSYGLSLHVLLLTSPLKCLWILWAFIMSSISFSVACLAHKNINWNVNMHIIVKTCQYGNKLKLLQLWLLSFLASLMQENWSRVRIQKGRCMWTLLFYIFTPCRWCYN
jgi:hypothetical protein